MSDFDLIENATAPGAESLLIVHAQNRSERLIVPALCDLGFSLANRPRQLVCLDSGSGDDHRNLENITGREVGKITIPEAGPGFLNRSAQDDAKLDCLARSLVKYDLVVEATPDVGVELLHRWSRFRDLQALLRQGYRAPQLIVTLSLHDSTFREPYDLFEALGGFQREVGFEITCVILDRKHDQDSGLDWDGMNYCISVLEKRARVRFLTVSYCYSGLFEHVRSGSLSLSEACSDDVRKFADLAVDSGSGWTGDVLAQFEQRELLEWAFESISGFRKLGLVPDPPTDLGEAA
ncbi:hypothetical protein NUH88_15885 [Nisaea acidiphila]|uniref:Uncharacterized protein n=1 Tax=Nisaea acidiphila TaxID=1862145 RepID=A0A9J7AMK1_9PROT|nr:hypothetical protein [Nisaea acidiphila]UUX48875.1 hypothetical protein NUH88_15885 [Nisaea acidiphila]